MKPFLAILTFLLFLAVPAQVEARTLRNADLHGTWKVSFQCTGGFDAAGDAIVCSGTCKVRVDSTNSVMDKKTCDVTIRKADFPAFPRVVELNVRSGTFKKVPATTRNDYAKWFLNFCADNTAEAISVCWLQVGISQFDYDRTKWVPGEGAHGPFNHASGAMKMMLGGGRECTGFWTISWSSNGGTGK